MATTSTLLYTGQSGTAGASLNAARDFPNAKNAYGKHRIIQIPYQVVSSTLPAAGDIIQLCKLPQGARVLSSLSRIICESPGTTLTLQVGDYSNAKRYSGVFGTAAGLVLSAASSTVGGGAIEFGSVPNYETYVPRMIAVNRALPAAWVTATLYRVGQQVISSNLTYTCLIQHTSGTFATDLTAINWVLSAEQQSWVTGRAYVIGDTIVYSGATATAPTAAGATYICTTAHTASAAFATDAANWLAVTPDETTVIATVISSGTMTAGKKVLFLLAVVDE